MRIRLVISLLFAGFLSAQTLSEALDLIQAGKIEQAYAQLIKLEQSKGRQPDILFLKGMIVKSADDAVRIYEGIIREFPQSGYALKARYRLAQLKYAGGFYKSALTLFHQILGTQTQEKLIHEAMYWAAQSHLAMNDKDSAIVYLERLLLQSPDLELVLLAQKELTALDAQSLFAAGAVPTTQLQNAQAEPTLSTMRPPPEITDTQPMASQQPPPPRRLLPAEAPYTVQVGAFSNQNNAMARRDFFENKGYTVQITQRPNESNLFLVWVGAFNTEQDARNIQEELRINFDARTTLIRN